MPVRANLEPVVREGGRLVHRRTSSQVAGAGGAESRLGAVLQRRLLDAEMAGDPGLALWSARNASLSYLHALLLDEVDLGRLTDLMAGFSLIRRWPDYTVDGGGQDAIPPSLPRAYALLKLCCLPFPLTLRGAEHEVPLEPGIVAALAAGHMAEALRRAATRLRGSGVPVHRAAALPELARGLRPGRLLAALLVPISPGAATALAESVSIPHESEVNV